MTPTDENGDTPIDKRTGEQPASGGEPLQRDHALREGENPHSHNVSGYRTMSDEDVARINALKERERDVAGMLRELTDAGGDPRHLAIARSRFEEAFMFAVKAVAKPADPYRG